MNFRGAFGSKTAPEAGGRGGVPEDDDCEIDEAPSKGGGRTVRGRWALARKIFAGAATVSSGSGWEPQSDFAMFCELKGKTRTHEGRVQTEAEAVGAVAYTSLTGDVARYACQGVTT